MLPKAPELLYTYRDFSGKLLRFSSKRLIYRANARPLGRYDTLQQGRVGREGMPSDIFLRR